MHLTVGTSLGVVLVSALASVLTHGRAGNVAGRAVPPLALASVAGAYLGARAAGAVAGPALERAFGAFMILVAARFVFARGPAAAREASPSSNPFGLGAIGALAGFVSAFFGVGGGVVAVPMLSGLAHFPLLRAIGTSSAMIVASASAGLATHVAEGLGHPGLPKGALGFFLPLGWALIAGASALAARAGARVATRAQPERLRRVFGVLLAVVGIRMILGH